MLRVLSLALSAVLLTLTPSFADDGDMEALLALHRRAREAHLSGNADLLASGTADQLLVISRAKINRQSREDVRKFFERYLADTKYSEWDDVTPPEIRISPDGKMAWMAVHIRARAKQGSEALNFESAWVATYEKLNHRWLMTSISSSIEEAPKPK
jgi:ketosteroid isomerase-like protein